jgi:hypothetical protein
MLNAPSVRPPNSMDDGRIKKKPKINRDPVDEVLDALLWMRRKAKKHKPIDDFIDTLVSMRRKTKKKAAKQTRSKGKRIKDGRK